MQFPYTNCGVLVTSNEIELTWIQGKEQTGLENTWQSLSQTLMEERYIL